LNQWFTIGRVGVSITPDRHKQKTHIYLAKFALSVTNIAADIKLTAI
jgi:hypothetical protein